MHPAIKMFCALALAAALATGCGGSGGPAGAAGSSEATGPDNAGGTEAPAEGVPDGARFVCHLSCSGEERSGYGATEEEAHAAAASHVEQTCRPEDGQYFIFCDPLS